MYAQACPRLENSLTGRTLNLESLDMVGLNMLFDVAFFLAPLPTLDTMPHRAKLAVCFSHERLHSVLDF